MMLRKWTLPLICWLAMALPLQAGASTIVRPLPNIFEGVNMISLPAVEDAILDAFATRQAMNTEHLRLQILGHEKGVRVDLDSSAYHMMVMQLDINHRSQQFGATLSFVADDGRQQEIAVNGRFDEVVDVPVLISRLPAKHIITQKDIRYETISRHSLRKQVVQDADYMLGKMLKRSVAVGRPVLARNLMEPLVVERNSAVTMVYRTPFITIRTSAVALEDGGKGEVIRVRNSHSSRIVQAVVEDEAMVLVAGVNEGAAL